MVIFNIPILVKNTYSNRVIHIDHKSLGNHMPIVPKEWRHFIIYTQRWTFSFLNDSLARIPVPKNVAVEFGVQLYYFSIITYDRLHNSPTCNDNNGPNMDSCWGHFIQLRAAFIDILTVHIGLASQFPKHFRSFILLELHTSTANHLRRPLYNPILCHNLTVSTCRWLQLI